MNTPDKCRAKTIEQNLKEKALDGNFSTRMRLYPNEAEMLRLPENGFDVRYFGYSTDVLKDSRKYPFDIFWSSTFEVATPIAVYEYISGQTECFPEVESFAQRLYVYAMKAHSK